MPTAPDGRVLPAEAPASSVSLSFSPGSSLTLWSAARPSHDTATECRLEVAPDRPVIVGRAEGHEVPYLDPAYRPTRVVPGTGQTVLQEDGRGGDVTVSRGHFMLRAHPGGVLFVNGVPRRGGGVRPPMNGTWLVAPTRRRLDPEEAYLIEHGQAAVFFLPNGAEIRIDAR
jgi:hypothetical protein